MLLTCHLVHLPPLPGVAAPPEHVGVVPARPQEVAPDVLVPGRPQHARVEGRGDADLEDDGKLDVIEMPLLHPGEGLLGVELVVEDEVHVDKIADKSCQFDDHFET